MVEFITSGKGLTGGGLIAPTGTALPTDTATQPDPAFIGTGQLTDEGLVKAFEMSVEKERNWRGEVVFIAQSEYGVTLQFTVMETLVDGTSAPFLEAMYGAENVTITPATTTTGTEVAIRHNADSLPEKAYVFDTRDVGKRTRNAVPRGKVSEKAEISYVSNASIKYGVTIDCLPDDSGTNVYEYLNDGVLAPGV